MQQSVHTCLVLGPTGLQQQQFTCILVVGGYTASLDYVRTAVFFRNRRKLLHGLVLQEVWVLYTTKQYQVQHQHLPVTSSGCRASAARRETKWSAGVQKWVHAAAEKVMLPLYYYTPTVAPRLSRNQAYIFIFLSGHRGINLLYPPSFRSFRPGCCVPATSRSGGIALVRT